MTSEAPVLPQTRPLHQRGRRFASLRVIVALMLREMATTYGRSAGGYIWAVLEPVAAIALLSAAFSLMFRSPALGINFPLFYATGMIPFGLWASVSGKLAQALLFSRPLLAYPSVTFVDALLARFILNVLTELMVAYIVFSGILLLFETRVIVDLPTIALSLAMASALALGVGTLNCFLFTLFPVWQRAWSIIMRPMFILACALFLYETVPQPYRDWLWYNPLVHVVGVMRRGFYTGYDATYVSLSYVFGVSAGLFMIGLLFLRRYHRDLIHN